ncbi:MAG: serine/threonine protein kinase [Candidatus Solibacter usitatus]|nr:serine/threonine protein kinase [Candidatus Solibacter usitatus]
MDFLRDSVVSHLRRVAEEPVLEGTRFTLERELGRGGIGVVWAVRDSMLGRSVALKVVDDAGEALLEEARAAAQLEHPGTVPVYDAGILPDGRAYYAMRLVQGLRLDEYAQSAALPEKLRTFLKICDAVAFAHSRGVIHRDLKPHNVMTGTFGEVFVLDWGIGVAGTPGYMAPEQDAGVAGDIFALGVMLRELLGQDLAKPVAAIAWRACAARPEDRYPNVLDLALDVRRFLDRESVSAYRETIYERLSRFAQRNSTLLLLIAAYFVTRFAIFFWRGR